MNILLALYIIFCAQLSNAAHSLRSINRKHSLSARSSSEYTRSLITTSKPFLASSWFFPSNGSEFTISNISWSSYSSVIYSFATTTPDANIIGLSSYDEELLPQFVVAARLNNVHPILSIGGWTGSKYFSSAVATEANRTAFAKAVMGIVSRFNLDGIEFDWEWPRRSGDNNTFSEDDSANFLSFLQTLRSQNGANNIIFSAAVSLTPFLGPDGKPMSDVSGFAKVLDYIEIMNYDVCGSWAASVGPNAPLRDSCAPTPQGSAMSAVKAWTDALFPYKQIILGVAAYGHSYHVTKHDAYNHTGNIMPYVPFDNSQQPARDQWNVAAGTVDECVEASLAGTFDFSSLIDCGFLTKKGNPHAGIDYVFDNCSETPFIYNPELEIMVSYDDANSFYAKGEYIKNASLAGFAMWSTSGDSGNILLNAINSALGNIP